MGTSKAQGLGLSARVVAAITAVLNALTPRPLTRALAFVVLLGRPLCTAARTKRWLRRSLACDDCEGQVCPQEAFLQAFHEQMVVTGGYDRFAEYIATGPRVRVARLLESFTRISALAWLRHSLLEGGDGPPPISEVHLSCCLQCDQGCQGCYSQCDRQGVAPDRRRLAQLIEEASRAGAVAIHLLGKGEPLREERFGLQLVQLADDHPHLFFSLATSGVHLTPALARAMGRAPNLLCLVSVDGLAATNDARRGAGTFEKARAGMRLLRQEGASFAFSSTVTSASWSELTSAAFLDEMRGAGCAMGIYSRFFSVEPGAQSPLRLSEQDLAEYRSCLAQARDGARMPLIDLDELEQATGCRARAGVSVYLDATTGQVAPCIRLPWAPSACRIGEAVEGELDKVLRHSFFAEYRAGRCARGPWCGADLDAEQQAMRACAKAREGTSVA